MCRANAEEVANALGHAHAVIKLWNSGQKSAAAWLLAHEDMTIIGLRNIGAPDWALYEIRPVFDYLLRKQRKLSHSDSVPPTRRVV